MGSERGYNYRDLLLVPRGLAEVTSREVCCYSISAKNQVNIDITMQWLMKHAKGRAPA
jgi:ADP-ribosylation factor-like protein 8